MVFNLLSHGPFTCKYFKHVSSSVNSAAD